MGKYCFMTVLGEVDENKLGYTQPHEHVYITGTIDQIRCKEICINNLPLSAEELKLYKAAGGSSVVDANPLATGRDVLALKDISRITGVNIIATTGYHIAKFYPQNHWIWTTPAEKLADLFCDEIVNGMYQDGNWYWPEYQTGCRAGLIKAMIDKEGLNKQSTCEHLKAVALASVRTGASIMLHTEGVDILETIDLLAGTYGVDTKKLLICHADRQVQDYQIHEAVAKTGVFLEYDTTTLFEFHNVAGELKLWKHMIDAGFLDQLLVSTDPTTDRLKQYAGSVGMDFILTEIYPLALQMGIKADALNQITHENAWRALSL